MTIQIVTAVLFPVLLSYIIFYLLPKKDFSNDKRLFVVAFVSAFLIKMSIAYCTDGFSTDIILFKAWGDLCNTVGFNTVYYQTSVYLDYPPAFLYILSLIDSIKVLFNFDYYNPIYTMLIKTPGIVADMLTGYFIYYISKKKFGISIATILSMIYVLNPLTIMDSSIWGQMDSICALFILVSLYFMSKKHFIPSGIIYGVGVLLKPQMLIFAPLYFIYTIVHKKYKGLIIGLLCAVASIFLLALPFSRDFDFTFLIDCYSSTLSYYHHYTVNAYNLYGFLGLNWGHLPENVVISSLYTWAGPFVATVLTTFYMWTHKGRAVLFNAAALIMSTVFMFTANMHERYLFPAIIMVLVVYIYTKDRRYLYVFTGFSVANFLNIAYVLYLNNTYISPTSPQLIIMSAMTLIVYFYYIYLVFFGYKRKPKEVIMNKKVKSGLKIVEEKVIDRKLYKKDYILMISIAVFYSFFAFWNLGANTTANTSWEPEIGESVILEIDGDYDTIVYLTGISTTDNDYYKVGCDFTLYFSDDGENFELSQVFENTSVYAWHELVVGVSTKYVKIVANNDTSLLNEIAFRNTSEGIFSTVTLIEGDGDYILDEQDSVPLYSDYYDSTYFDEIYHARTAYEYILGVEAYENTHPTLGKLFISLSILIFGMNPFGWRFAGALFGVLMLPVLYHILKRLFGSSFIASCGTLLFAFDFMHFTQTRIATIDTYAVFFILLMYDAMIIFIQKDIVKSSLKSLLLPLAFSGIFMGLGVASKWTCAYGAVGLAVLYFAKIIVTYKNGENQIKNKCLTLCLYCLLFFVLIPFLIYFCAFLPLTTIEHNASDIWGSFINYQTHMYNYHSQLVATHYFASPWYEWPLVIRNIWYFVDNNYDGTGLISTISCLGNPVIWWTSLVALLFVVWRFIKTRQQSLGFIIVGFLAVYLPWTLVPRLTFIYHYFTAVPFIIMALMYVFKLYMDKNSKPILSKYGVSISKSQVVILSFVIINFGLFILFFPAISGYPTTNEYIDFLTWMPNWYLG